MLQESFLFNGTIASNIGIADSGAGNERIEVVATIAGVSQFLADFPDGFDTQVGERGGRLSGGQRQRVAIARTLVLDAQVIVADEPTGNLDEDNTAEVIELFQRIAHERDKCVIIVTHETAVAAACDVSYRLSYHVFTKE